VKNFLLACLGVSVVTVAACSQEGPGSGTGTAGSSGGTSSAGNAGTTGQGGSAVGGTTGQAGDGAGGSGNGGSGGSSAAGSGGSSVAGSIGSGGAAGDGAGGTSAGNAGSGGSTTARGGAGGSVGSGGTAGSSAGRGGTGGSAGSGGTAGSSAGRGGTGGSAGSGGTAGSGALTVASIVPDLVGFYWEGTCVGNTDPGGRNCPMFDKGATCPTGATYDLQGVIRDKVFNVGGTPGQKYTVNIEVRGVIGGRCYTGGTRASTAAASDTGYNNWWYVGGAQYNNSWWNTYELHVTPATGDKDVYFLNAADNAGGSYCEKEATYLVKYNASFKVVGGGQMKWTIHDSNCKAQQNCGPTASSTAPCAPRNVDLSGQSPQPPASFMQPPRTVLSTTYYPQWLWITATSVTAVP
jgi:hypothetical protein